MKESDAKTKWCPMVRFHCDGGGDVFSNKPDGETRDNSGLCIASDCMMWVYTSTSPAGKIAGNGHCGLAKWNI